MSPDDMSPEQRLRRLRDPDRWEDATLTPRRIPTRAPLVQRFAGVAAAVVVAAGLVVGFGALVLHSSSSASSGSVAGAAASSAADSTSPRGSAEPGAQTTVPFASRAPSTFQSNEDRAPLDALAVAITGPSAARAGTDLQLVVTLRNTGTSAIRFDRCPDYSQTLTVGTARVTQQYALNCQSVPKIPAKGSVAFAMRVPIPASASGTAIYEWALDEGSSASFALKITKG